MRLKAFLLVLFLLVNFFAISQDTAYQKLLSLKDDTSKVKALINYGRQLLDVDNSAAEPVFRTSIDIIDRL